MIKLKSLKLKNYKVHRDFEVVFDPEFYELKRPNEFGKSTIFEAICDAFSFSVDKIKDKSTKGVDNLPVIILDFDLNNEIYTLTLNAQSNRILLESKGGVYRESKRSISDFFARMGYKMFPFVISHLLLIREKDITLNTDNPDLKRFTGDIFNVENINGLIKIISDKFLSEKKPGLKKSGFGDVLVETINEIDILRGEIREFDEKVREYEKARKEYEGIKEEKEKTIKEIDEKENLLGFLKILREVKRNEELNTQKESLKKQLNKFQKEYSNLLDTVKNLSERLKVLENSRRKLKEDIDKTLKLMSEIRELEHEYEKINDNLNHAEKLGKELEKLQESQKFREKELKALENESEVLNTNVKTLGEILKIYEEIEKLKSALKFIKDKKDKLKDVNNNLTELLKEEKVVLKQLKEKEEEKEKLLKNLKELERKENLGVLRERLLNVEEELTGIYNALKDIEKLQKEIEDIKKKVPSVEGFTEDELKDALFKWQALLEQKSSAKGEISVLNGSVFIEGKKRLKGESYIFEGEATIEKDDLKLKVYTLLSLKQKEEELSKYIQHFKSMDILKETISALESIKEKEIRISSLEPQKLKKRNKELEKEQIFLKNKIKVLEKQQKALEKLQKDIEELNVKYRKKETGLSKIQGVILQVKEQKEEIERELKEQEEDELKDSLKNKEVFLEEKFRELGYENPLSEEKVKEIYTGNTDEFSKKREEFARKMAELDGVKERITGIQKELDLLSPDKIKETQKAILNRIMELKKELKDKEDLEKRLNSVEVELKTVQKELEELSKKQGFLESSIKSIEEKIKEVEKIINSIEVEEDSLDNIPFGVVKRYINFNSEDIEREIQSAEETAVILRKKLTEVSEMAGVLKAHLEHAPDIKSLEQKRVSLLEYERKLERIEKMKAVLKFSKDALILLRENIEKEYLLRISEETGRLFSQITDGRYHIAHFNSDTLFVGSKKKDSFEKRWKVEDTKGNIYSFDELSDGTKTQLLLSIRLALISLFFGKNTAFLMLDEPFAYFDSKREENTRRILSHLSEMNWQVLIISART